MEPPISFPLSYVLCVSPTYLNESRTLWVCGVAKII